MAELNRQHPGYFENGKVTKTGQSNLCHSLDTGILRYLPAELQPLRKIIETCFDDEVWEKCEPGNVEPETIEWQMVT